MSDRSDRGLKTPPVEQRRGLLRIGAGAPLLALPFRDAGAATIQAARVWPASDYTRITLELNQPVFYNHTLLAQPYRLLVTLEGLQVNDRLYELANKVRSNDPYVHRIRIGRPSEAITRIVFDLKQPIRPDLFTLAPIDRYSHRLVIDLHPTRVPDPLVSLLAQQDINRRSPVLTVTPMPTKPDPLASIIQQSQARSNKASHRRPVRGRRSKTAPIQRLVTVAIDAGHGGEDPGALGQQGTYEKNIVLPIAAELRQLIREQPGMRAFMTREGDYFVPLRQRVDKVRRVSADLFVSIHADAARYSKAQGASVYVLSAKGATSTAASWLAARENRADRVGGIRHNAAYDQQARRLLMEMSVRRRTRASDELGRNVLQQLAKISPIHKPRVERAAFMVLKTPDIPAILVETAFLSNSEDEKRLRNAHNRRQIARAIFNGIQGYLKIGPGVGKRQV